MNFEGQQLKISKKNLIRSRTIVKSAVLNYIESWFREGSSNYDLLKTIIGENIQYSIKEWSIQDQTKKNTTIMNYFEKVKQELPSIIVIDSGITTRQDIQGFGPSSSVWEDGRKKFVVRRVMDVGISILIGTMDQGTTNQLTDLMLLIFDSLRQIACGSELQSNDPEDPWVVRLPLNNINPSPLNEAPIDSATNDKIWATTIDLPGVQFETSFKVELDGQFPTQGNKTILPETTTIVFNESQIKLGEDYRISYTPYVPNMRFWVNAREASILYKEPFFWLKGTKLGPIEVKLVDTTRLSKTKTYDVVDTLYVNVI